MGPRTKSTALALAFALAAAATATGAAPDRPDRQPPALKHHPAVSRTHVAFVYANDVWCAPKAGGVAVPLTDAPGAKSAPRFSPDGTRIAFSANLEGDSELYTVPVAGGTPTRVTYLPSSEALCQWTRDDRLVFWTNSLSFNRLAMQLFAVPAGGGMPARLPVPYGADGAISDDGEWLAYTEVWPNLLMGTWKRYRGGMAQNIRLFNLRTHASRLVTEWEGADHRPMWHGATLYYVSDAGPEHRHNIWAYDTASGSRRQVTRFDAFDVRNPSVGHGEIVFQYGADLFLLDLASGRTRALEIAIPQEHLRVPTATVDAARHLTSISVAPDGARLALEARGDVWLLGPDGAATNATRTSGVFERDPAWSPDGRWLAYLSDATGEYELYVAGADGADGSGARRLTNLGPGFRYRPVWSPDSTALAFADGEGALLVHRVDGGETRPVDRDPWGRQPQVAWSHDASWIAYTKTDENDLSSVWLYEVATGASRRATSGMFADTAVAFDRRGDYLFVASTRNYTSPTINPALRTFLYTEEDTLLVVPLRSDLRSPVGAPAREAKAEPFRIDVEGFERRAITLPVRGWGVGAPAVDAAGNPVYVRAETGGARSVRTFDLAAAKERTLLDGVAAFALSADGRVLVAREGANLTTVRLDAADAAPTRTPLPRLEVTLDRRAEWRQIFADAWRLYRDFFYDPRMHGVDWRAVRDRYAPLVDACATREDLNVVLAEMAGELNVGHAYIARVGDVEQTPPASTTAAVGMLGADLEAAAGGVRIARIYEGAPWDPDSRGPLAQPGVGARVGDYLLAVDGKPVDPSRDPRAAFVGLADRDVTLTLGDAPRGGATREVRVRTASGENGPRYAAWVEANRAYVERKSGGRVGYIHLPDFGTGGLNALVRQLQGQTDKEALVVDARWSQGGSLGDIFARMLDWRTLNYLGSRGEGVSAIPLGAQHGPKALVVSGMTVSAGENFASYFRKWGLGTIVGARTWGGLIGLNGNPALVDGGALNVPNAPFFEDDGTWMVEGHGVEPDVVVADDPALVARGEEPQLDAAIRAVLEELERRPPRAPRRPVAPDRSGMGVERRDQ